MQWTITITMIKTINKINKYLEKQFLSIFISVAEQFSKQRQIS